MKIYRQVKYSGMAAIALTMLAALILLAGVAIPAQAQTETLLYQFTIEDPATWAKPWSGEMTWPTTDGHIYEYACHEGNYAMTDILRGARHREKEQASAKAAN